LTEEALKISDKRQPSVNRLVFEVTVVKGTSLPSVNRRILEEQATMGLPHLSPGVGHDNGHDKVA